MTSLFSSPKIARVLHIQSRKRKNRENVYESRDQLTTILSDHAEHHFYALCNWCLRLRHFGRSLVFEYVVTSVNMLVLLSGKNLKLMKSLLPRLLWCCIWTSCFRGFIRSGVDSTEVVDFIINLTLKQRNCLLCLRIFNAWLGWGVQASH